MPFEIDFTSPFASAATPFEANDEHHFHARARIAVEFAASRPVPLDWLVRLPVTEWGEDTVVSAIALLERGGQTTVQFGNGSQTSVDTISLVNDALERAVVNGQVGTDFPDFPVYYHGDWDVVIKGLIVILYRHEAKLRQCVYDHVLHDLLVVNGARPADSDWWAKPDPKHRFVIGIRETENHILMIETSRYLTNQLLSLERWRKDESPDEAFDNIANGMTAWMLAHLKVFLQHDFWEYNSLPYQRYSMAALQNLNDFAWDDEVKTAARTALDYVSAKTAVSSNRLRRSVPFRRRLDELNKTGLFEPPVDAQTSRFLMLSGYTAGLAEVGGKAHDQSSDQLLLAALTIYRVPEMLLDLVMDKGHNTYYQQFHHGDHDGIPGGVEIYASEPNYLITAGGIWIRSGNGDFDENPLDPYQQCGNAVETTLMPTRSGIDRNEFIRITGGFYRDRVNNGILRNFACGRGDNNDPGVIIPARFMTPGTAVGHGHWTFINASDSCPDQHNRLGFYVAAYSEVANPDVPGSKANEGTKVAFGFFEVASADHLTFDDFRRTVLQHNEDRHFSARGVNKYLTVDGHEIHFTPFQDEKYSWAISAVDRVPTESNIHTWPLARGDIVNSDGHTGIVTVDNPFLRQRLVLDMRDPVIPRRYQFRTDVARHTANAFVSPDLYRLDAFWVGPGDAVTEIFWDWYVNQGTWGLPALLTGAGHARATSQLVTVARTSESLDVFWIGPDHRVHTNWRAAGTNRGEWHLPFTIPLVKDSDVASAVSQLAAVSRTPEQLDLIWVGQDGALRTHWWNGPTGSKPWVNPGTHLAFPITAPGTARLYSPLSIIARRPNCLDVFWIAPDGSVWTHWWNEGRAGAWHLHQPRMIGYPGAARPWSALSAIARTPASLAVFWVGPDSAVWTRSWREDGDWDDREPERVTPENSVGSRSGVASVSRVPNQIDLFWVTSKGSVASVFRNDFSPEGKWIGPFDVTPPAVAHTHSPVYALAREPQHLDLMWIGANGDLWTHWWDERGGDKTGWFHDKPFAVTPPGSVQLPG